MLQNKLHNCLNRATRLHGNTEVLLHIAVLYVTWDQALIFFSLCGIVCVLFRTRLMKDTSYFVWTACYRSYCPGTLFMSARWAIRYSIDITFEDSYKRRSGFWFFYRSIRYICRLTVSDRSVCFPRSRARNLSTRLLVAHRMGYADICCHLIFVSPIIIIWTFWRLCVLCRFKRDL